ncbi:MAG: DUF2459 domain-containing protein [Steroidobacteraceae bacterium]
MPSTRALVDIVSWFVRSIIAIAPLLIGGLTEPSAVTAQTVRSSAAGTPSLESPGAPKAMMIFVARRRWHVDVGFAARDLGAPLDALAAQFPGVKYLFFGFGDRHYLTAKHQALPAMLGALWPGPGMMLVTGLKDTPTRAFGSHQVIELGVSAAQAAAAQAFIWGSFAMGRGLPAGRSLRAYAAGPYEGSLYFRAVPRYSAIHTCNTWAAEALRAAGLPVRSRAMVFAGQLWAQTQKLASPGPSLASAPRADEAPPDAHGASLPQ